MYVFIQVHFLDSFLYFDPKQLFDNGSIIKITDIYETLATEVTCLKNSANGQTMMHRFKTILEEWGEVNRKLMRSDMSKLIINKHEYICNCVCWNNVNGPG